MTFAAADRFAVAPDATAREVGDEIVILDVAAGLYFGLDGVGARAWTLLAEGRSLGEAAEAILAEYETARETVEADLAALTGDLLERGLLVRAAPT